MAYIHNDDEQINNWPRCLLPRIQEDAMCVDCVGGLPIMRASRLPYVRASASRIMKIAGGLNQT